MVRKDVWGKGPVGRGVGVGDRVRVLGSELDESTGTVIGVSASGVWVDFPGGMPPTPFPRGLLELVSSDTGACAQGKHVLCHGRGFDWKESRRFVCACSCHK